MNLHIDNRNYCPKNIDVSSPVLEIPRIQEAVNQVTQFHGKIGFDHERPSGLDIFDFIRRSHTGDMYGFYWNLLIDFVGDLKQIDGPQFQKALEQLIGEYYPSYQRLSEVLLNKERCTLGTLFHLPPVIRDFLQHTYHILRFQTNCPERHNSFEHALKVKDGVFVMTPTRRYYLKFYKTKTIVNPSTGYMLGFPDWYMNIFMRVFREHTGLQKHICVRLDQEIPSIQVPEDDWRKIAKVKTHVCQKIMSVPEKHMEIVDVKF